MGPCAPAAHPRRATHFSDQLSLFHHLADVDDGLAEVGVSGVNTEAVMLDQDADTGGIPIQFERCPGLLDVPHPSNQMTPSAAAYTSLPAGAARSIPV